MGKRHVTISIWRTRIMGSFLSYYDSPDISTTWNHLWNFDLKRTLSLGKTHQICLRIDWIHVLFLFMCVSLIHIPKSISLHRGRAAASLHCSIRNIHSLPLNPNWVIDLKTIWNLKTHTFFDFKYTSHSICHQSSLAPRALSNRSRKMGKNSFMEHRRLFTDKFRVYVL